MYVQDVPPEFRSCIYADAYIGPGLRGTRVSLNDRKLTSVPEWLRNLTAVASLDLNGNQLTAVPKWIGNLTGLKRLSLYSNRLTGLPESIGNLTALSGEFLWVCTDHYPEYDPGLPTVP